MILNSVLDSSSGLQDTSSVLMGEMGGRLGGLHRSVT